MATFRLAIRKSGGESREVALSSPVVWLGRDASCEVRLEDSSVSRKHAEMRMIEGGVEIYNRSEFGVLRINGTEVKQGVLKPGDRAGLGVYEVSLESAEPTAVKTPLENPMDRPLQEFSGGGQDEGQQAQNEADLAPLAPEMSLEPAEQPTDQPPEQAASQAGLGLEEFLSPELIENSNPEGTRTGEQSQSAAQTGAASQQMEAAPEIEASPQIESAQETTSGGNTRVLSNRRFDVRLVFAPGAANVQEYFIRKQKIVIGRGSDCDVILTTKKASRHHAVIERRGMLFSIRDLGSANGILVNGLQVSEKELAADDRIQIGESEFQFVALSDMVGVSTSPSIMQERTQSQGFMQPEAAAIPGDLVAGLPPAFTGQIEHQAAKSAPIAAKASLLEKFKALPTRKKIVYAAVALAAVLFMFEEDPVPVKRNRKVATNASGERKPLTAADLSPEQQKYIETQYTSALDAFRGKDYDQALLALQKIFEILPDYRDAREYERYAQEGKRSREELAERKRKEEEEIQLRRRIAQLTEEVGGLMKRKEFEVAEQLFSEIQAIDPENAQVKTWQAEIAAERDRERQLAEDARIREEIDRKAQEVVARGRSSLKAGRYIAAIQAFIEVPKTGTQNKRILKDAQSGVREAKTSLDVRVKPILELAAEAQSRGDLIEAFKQYRAVLQIDPTSSKARIEMRAMRDTLHERGKTLYTEGVLAESYSDFETARQRFEEVMTALPDDDLYYQRASRKLLRISKFLTKEKI